MAVRVRFAPSPTGMLHVGALRTALYDSLLARKHGGQNILRVEDTDRNRYNEDSEREFIRTLKWVGIEFDEGPHVGGPFGPYRQSERKAAGLYQPWVEKLLQLGHAYRAFETPEELEEMREIQQINKQPTGYFGGSWRDASAAKVLEMGDTPYVVRQRVPRGKKIVTEDFVRGRVEFDSDTLPDPVLIKADGMPTYHFAAMVDDHLMEITHVLRGEEWLSSAPFHMLLFEQFGWEKPVFVHCPVIVDKSGKKLSKRHGATRVLDYAAHGCLKGALKNFIALIGWSPGNDQEIFSEDELVAAFDLRGLQPSPGRFDVEKMRWLNGHAIREMQPEKLLATLLEFIDNSYTSAYWSQEALDLERETAPSGLLPGDGPILERLHRVKQAAVENRAYVLAALKETQERVQTLVEFGEALEFFLVDEPPMDVKAAEKWLSQEHVRELFDWILAKLAETRVETAEHYESMLRGYQTHKGLDKLGPVVHPTRVALTGKTTGPGLFELMAVLGHDRIAKRLRRALEMT